MRVRGGKAGDEVRGFYALLPAANWAGRGLGDGRRDAGNRAGGRRREAGGGGGRGGKMGKGGGDGVWSAPLNQKLERAPEETTCTYQKWTPARSPSHCAEARDTRPRVPWLGGIDLPKGGGLASSASESDEVNPP